MLKSIQSTYQIITSNNNIKNLKKSIYQHLESYMQNVMLLFNFVQFEMYISVNKMLNNKQNSSIFV